MKKKLHRTGNKNLKFLIPFILLLFINNIAKSQCLANCTVSYNLNGNVSFNNTSTYIPGATTFTWYFGDGGASTQVSPNHTYASNGTYTVYLGITSGTVPPVCSSTMAVVVTVTNSPCNLPINAAFTGTAGLAGTYTVNSTSTGTTGGASYIWYWGDGSTATGPNASHIYGSNNWYQISLKINDGVCNDSTFQWINISTVGCSLSASFSSTNGLNGLVNFSSTTTGTVPGTNYSWNYGDGNSGSGIAPSHVYLNNGSYTVSLLASNPNGTMAPICTSSSWTTVSVVNATCNILASFTNTNGPAGTRTVASTSTGTNLSTTYQWYWGDGGTASGQNASHTYTANGSYNVSLVINNGGNCIDSTNQWLTISNITCSITANFSYTSNISGLVNFASTSTGTIPATTYTWNYGDGSTGSGAVTSHTYSNPGIYNVSLMAYNPNGTLNPVCFGSYTTAVVVNCNVNAAFNYTVGPGGVVNYASTSTGTIPGSSYFWDYGDGGFGTGLTSTHTYSNGGIHSVALSVANGSFCVDSVNQSVNVNTLPCTANSNFTVVYSGTPLFWNASPAYYGNVINAIWYWGDGSSDNALYPSHTYSAAGFYNVCLSVTVSCALTSSNCSAYSIFKTSAPVDVSQAMVYISVVPNNSTGIKKMAEENASVNLFPNPTDGKLNIKINNINYDTKTAGIEVYDVLGKMVYSKGIETVSGSIDKTLNLEHLSNGSYYVRVKTDYKTYQSRLILNK